MLLHDASRSKYLKRMRNPRGMGALERGNLHKKIVTECKKSTTCFNEACYAVNGTVKKVDRLERELCFDDERRLPTCALCKGL